MMKAIPKNTILKGALLILLISFFINTWAQKIEGYVTCSSENTSFSEIGIATDSIHKDSIGNVFFLFEGLTVNQNQIENKEDLLGEITIKLSSSKDGNISKNVTVSDLGEPTKEGNGHRVELKIIGGLQSKDFENIDLITFTFGSVSDSVKVTSNDNGLEEHDNRDAQVNIKPPLNLSTKATDSQYFTKENKFKEKELGNNDLVYVYDMASDGNRLYKVYNESDSLTVSPLNFNNEIITPKTNLRIKVVNANRYLYDIQVDDTLIRRTSEMSKIIEHFYSSDNSALLEQQLNLLPVTKQESDGKADGASADATAKGRDATETEENNQIATISNLLRDFHRDYITMKTIILHANNKNAIFPNNPENSALYAKLSSQLLEIKTLIALDESNLWKKQLQCDEAKLRIKNKSIAPDEIKKIVDKISKVDKDLEKKKGDKDLLAEKKELEKKKIDWELYKDIPETEINKLKEKVTDLEGELSYHKTLTDIIKLLPTEKKLAEMQSFINNMDQFNAFYQLDHIPLHEDKLKLDISIVKRDSAFAYGALDSIAFSADIPIYRPFSFSFSQGVFAGLIGGQNKTYEWQALANNNGHVADKDNAKYRLYESGYTPLPYGFNGLFNLHYNFRRSTIKLGLSAGPGITLQKSPSVNYMAGLSLAFDDRRDNQLVLTLGVTRQNVEKIKHNLFEVYEQGITYQGSSKPNIEYYKEARYSAFFSLSYTIFNNVKMPFKAKNQTSTTGEDNQSNEID